MICPFPALKLEKKTIRVTNATHMFQWRGAPLLQEFAEKKPLLIFIHKLRSFVLFKLASQTVSFLFGGQEKWDSFQAFSLDLTLRRLRHSCSLILWSQSFMCTCVCDYCFARTQTFFSPALGGLFLKSVIWWAAITHTHTQTLSKRFKRSIWHFYSLCFVWLNFCTRL